MAKRTEAAEPRKTYKVDYPHGLNLRAEPSQDAEILRVLKTGETVTVAGEEAPDGWMAVKGGGYCMKEYLK